MVCSCWKLMRLETAAHTDSREGQAEEWAGQSTLGGYRRVRQHLSGLWVLHGGASIESDTDESGPPWAGRGGGRSFTEGNMYMRAEGQVEEANLVLEQDTRREPWDGVVGARSWWPG